MKQLGIKVATRPHPSSGQAAMLCLAAAYGVCCIVAQLTQARGLSPVLHSLPVGAGKVVRLRQKLSDITGAVTGIFGRKSEKDPAVAKLDALKVSGMIRQGCAIS